LKSIDVAMILGRGRFLFDGTVPGMDEVYYDCRFVLENLKSSGEEVQIGFPVDSEFTRLVKETPEEGQNWVLNYGFIAVDEKTTYSVRFVHRKPRGPKEFAALFVWKMHFGPNETRTLRVTYHMPISMGLSDTRRDEMQTRTVPSEAFSREFMTLAQVELAGYITSTGSSWSGNVDTAKFAVYLDKFEEYFNHRGITEEDPSKMSAEQAERFSASFPLNRPWWFREISPTGWKPIEGGIQWEYQDYKPQRPIEVAYYMTQLPKTASDVHPFVELFLKDIRKNDSAADQLSKLREFILATFGKEPQGPAVRAFASDQKWYAPRKDFSLSELSSEQRGVLDALDKEISIRAGN